MSEWSALVALAGEHGIALPEHVPPGAIPIVSQLLELFTKVLADAGSLTANVRTLRAEIQTFTAEARRMAEGVEAQAAAITVLGEDARALVGERDNVVAELAVAVATIRELRGNDEDEERLAIQTETFPTSWERILRVDPLSTEPSTRRPRDDPR